MRNLILIGAVFLLFAGAALAQDPSRQELQNFDRFLDSHPAIHKDLQNNPSLVNNSAYLSAHPELKEFLGSHPDVREDIKEHPKSFMNRERSFEKSGKDITRPEVKNFDDFLDKHPAVDKELRKNPSLVNNEDYLEKHPELKEFLNAHPAIRHDLAEHPGAFMHREKGFDKAERKTDQREDRRENKAERQEERREEQRERNKLRFTQHPVRNH